MNLRKTGELRLVMAVVVRAAEDLAIMRKHGVRMEDGRLLNFPRPKNRQAARIGLQLSSAEAAALGAWVASDEPRRWLELAGVELPACVDLGRAWRGATRGFSGRSGRSERGGKGGRGD